MQDDMDKCGDMNKSKEGKSVNEIDHKVEDAPGMDYDKADKKKKEKKLDKCGEMKVAKSEVSSQKLADFLKKNS